MERFSGLMYLFCTFYYINMMFLRLVTTTKNPYTTKCFHPHHVTQYLIRLNASQHSQLCQFCYLSSAVTQATTTNCCLLRKIILRTSQSALLYLSYYNSIYFLPLLFTVWLLQHPGSNGDGCNQQRIRYLLYFIDTYGSTGKSINQYYYVLGLFCFIYVYFSIYCYYKSSVEFNQLFDLSGEGETSVMCRRVVIFYLSLSLTLLLSACSHDSHVCCILEFCTT